MNTLAALLCSRVRAEVFRLLFALLEQELHLREIGRQSGLSVSTVRQDLEKLVGLDLVKTRRDGNRLYYRANMEHPLYSEIHGLVLKTVGLADVLCQALGSEGIEVAFVFGSLGRDEARAESDIDLMVVGDVGLRELSRRLAGVAQKLGREVNPHVLSPTEFQQRRGSADHFITGVLTEPRLLIVGSEDDLARMA
ncbi:MAG: nucleotidyltransferase domain-containing protein [Candidatus Brocadiae bacterium]|nr:nucleotidyltransferase domain-containing protein [Candidatus Brocadiia bacterium]